MLLKKTGFLLLLSLSCSLSLQAAEKLDQSKKVITEANNILQKNQASINNADATTMQMFDSYKNVNNEIDNYLIYNRQLKDIVASQEAEKQQLQRSIEGVEATAQQIMPFMEKIITSLASFIDSDYPFLATERKARIDSLKANMKRADISVAAKYRQILEAYQIEMDYGNTIETYDGEIDAKKVTFLKVGRIGYYYLSFDKNSAYAWDLINNKWHLLKDGDLKRSIATGIKIAKKQKTPELFFVALPPAEVRK